MAEVGIVTDSSSCLPAKLTRQYGIRVVPLGFSIDGTGYLDQVDLTSDEFWRLFKEAKEMPTVSAVNAGAFVTAFTELARSADSIVCITVSRGLSATNEAALQARKILRDKHPNVNIEIIDSKTSTGALGFVVLEAARAASAGKSLPEVAGAAHDLIPKVKFVVAMETLKYLIKIGRAPRTAYFGEMLGIKPLIGVVSGTGLVDSLGRIRAKRKAMARLIDMIGDYTDTSKPIHLMTHYTDSIQDGQELMDIAISRYDCAEVYLTPFTPVMACATGPVVSLSFYS